LQLRPLLILICCLDREGWSNDWNGFVVMIDPDWSFDRSRLKPLLFLFEAMINSDQEAWLIEIEIINYPD